MPFASAEEANLAASTKTTNRLSGNTLEFVPFNARVRVYAASSAANVNITFLVDQEVVIDDQEIINIATTLNKSDHILDEFDVAQGSRLSLTLRETGAVATTDVLWGVEVVPM